METPRKSPRSRKPPATTLQQAAPPQSAEPSPLFDRVVAILEAARSRATRAVHSQMVLAYFQIGREIVVQIQRGDARAEYGQRVIEELSHKLTERYGRGYSTTNLRYFRTFYLTYCRREPQIRHITSGESAPVPASLLIDLKLGKLTHQDVGQMDSYVRLFDEKYTTEGDNPTIGLILCAEKNAAVARYSVLHESKQLFAAKYVTYLPTEEELQRELRRERLIREEHTPSSGSTP